MTTTQSVSNSTKRNSDSRRPSGLFWKFGAEFHGDEALRADATDFVIFTAMALLCAWPIVSVAIAIVRVFLG